LGGYEIGGKGVFFERKINIPDHKRVTISFTIFALDSWDNEFFIVTADGTEIVKEKFLYNTGSKVCANAGWKDRTKFIRITIDHDEPNLTLRFTSNLNEASTNESFGFNILDIIYCDSGDECISNDHISDFAEGRNKLELVRDDANIQTDWTSNLAEGDWTTTCDN